MKAIHGMGVGERRIAAAAREPWRERTVARVDLGEEAGLKWCKDVISGILYMGNVVTSILKFSLLTK